MESCETTAIKDEQQNLKIKNETKNQVNGEVNSKIENVKEKTIENKVNDVGNKLKQDEEATLSNGISKTDDGKRTSSGSGSQSPTLNASKTSNALPSNITEALEQQLTPILEACVNNNGNIAHLQQQLAAAVSQVTVTSNANSSIQSPGLASQSPQRTSSDAQTAASMLAAQLSIAVANAVNKTKTSPSNQTNKSNEVSPSSWSQQQQAAASKNADKSPANPSTTKLGTSANPKANSLSSTIQSLNQLTQLVGSSNNNSSTMQQALNSIYSPNQLMKSFNNNNSTNGVGSKSSSSSNGQYRANNIYTENNGEIEEQINTSGKASNGAFDMSMLNTQLLDLLRQDPSQIEHILKLKSLYQMGGGEDNGVVGTGFLEELQQLDTTVPANMAVVAAAVALAQQQSANGTSNVSSNGPSVSNATAAALANSLHQTNLTQQLNNLGLNNLNNSGVNVINNRVNGGIGNSPRSTLNMIQGFQQSNNHQNNNFTPNTKQQYQFSQQQNHHMHQNANNSHQFNSHHHSNNSNGHHGNHIVHHNNHHHHHQPSSGGQQQHYQYNMMHMSLQQQQQHLQQQQLNQDFHEERFSRKVFVGGLPPDIDEDEIVTHFRRYGNLIVDWPHKAESKSYFPPKGYAFLIFQEERSVQDLIETCVMDDGKLYMVVSSPSMKDKPVQIRPWCLADSDFVMDGSQPLDPRKTIFVGGVPRPLKAIELAMIMDRFYGGVCYAGIDTDPELKYPKGAGRVAFSNQQSYIAAISARFVQLQHGEIDKRVEVKPYVLDDQMCDECQGARCGGKFAPFFCANVTCLQYYCEFCWGTIHTRPGREYHKPLVKEGADRPRPQIPYK